MGMKSKQEKALELRDLVTKYNEIRDELEEDGCKVTIKSGNSGKLFNLKVSKTVIL